MNVISATGNKVLVCVCLITVLDLPLLLCLNVFIIVKALSAYFPVLSGYSEYISCIQYKLFVIVSAVNVYLYGMIGSLLLLVSFFFFWSVLQPPALRAV